MALPPCSRDRLELYRKPVVNYQAESIHIGGRHMERSADAANDASMDITGKFTSSADYRLLLDLSLRTKVNRPTT